MSVKRILVVCVSLLILFSCRKEENGIIVYYEDDFEYMGDWNLYGADISNSHLSMSNNAGAKIILEKENLFLIPAFKITIKDLYTNSVGSGNSKLIIGLNNVQFQINPEYLSNSLSSEPIQNEVEIQFKDRKFEFYRNNEIVDCPVTFSTSTSVNENAKNFIRFYNSIVDSSDSRYVSLDYIKIELIYEDGE